MSGAHEVTNIDVTELKRRIDEIIKKSEGIRPAARMLQIDPAYLKRLRDGDKTNPSPLVLKKLRLRKVVKIKYERR